MKAFLISASLMIIFLGCWLGFSYYADITLNDIMDIGKNEVNVAIKDGDWADASTDMAKLSDKWKEHRKIYSLFFRTSVMNETDFAIAKATEFIDAEDESNSSGEVSNIVEQLKFLNLNELFTLENIF